MNASLSLFFSVREDSIICHLLGLKVPEHQSLRRERGPVYAARSDHLGRWKNDRTLPPPLPGARPVSGTRDIFAGENGARRGASLFKPAPRRLQRVAGIYWRDFSPETKIAPLYFAR